jgi:hypothetical protein
MKPVQMRMARAFIASVPMGVVLVAALVVPLTVIPGTFGFESWPTSRRDQVTEQQVRLAPPKVDVVAVRPRQAVPARHPVLVAAARPRPVNPSPNVVALAPAPRRTPVRVSAPTPTRDSGPRPAPSQPTQQPAPPAEQPTKDPSGALAGGEVPVARELAPQEPPPQPVQQPAAPQPAPVEQAPPVPVERLAPEPCHGHDGGQHGDGDSQE